MKIKIRIKNEFALLISLFSLFILVKFNILLYKTFLIKFKTAQLLNSMFRAIPVPNKICADKSRKYKMAKH